MGKEFDLVNTRQFFCVTSLQSNSAATPESFFVKLFCQQEVWKETNIFESRLKAVVIPVLSFSISANHQVHARD